jgi:hypothetical protein
MPLADLFVEHKETIPQRARKLGTMEFRRGFDIRLVTKRQQAAALQTANRFS